MKNRQTELEAKMSNDYSYGQEKFCAHCWACVHGEECFALPENRFKNCLCANAEKRMQEQGEKPMPRKRAKGD